MLPLLLLVSRFSSQGVYVQEVDKAAICRSNAPCGILCEWLMAGEQYMYMGLLLDEARARMAEYNKATSPSSACPPPPLPSPVEVVPDATAAEEVHASPLLSFRVLTASCCNFRLQTMTTQVMKRKQGLTSAFVVL